MDAFDAHDAQRCDDSRYERPPSAPENQRGVMVWPPQDSGAVSVSVCVRVH